MYRGSRDRTVMPAIWRLSLIQGVCHVTTPLHDACFDRCIERATRGGDAIDQSSSRILGGPGHANRKRDVRAACLLYADEGTHRDAGVRKKFGRNAHSDFKERHQSHVAADAVAAN